MHLLPNPFNKTLLFYKQKVVGYVFQLAKQVSSNIKKVGFTPVSLKVVVYYCCYEQDILNA